MSFQTFSFILHHPLNQKHKLAALGRFFRWQLRSRLLGGKVIVPFVSGTRLAMSRGMTSATGNLYCGLQDFEEMAFVLHALRPGDLLLDIGANVGTYSVLAGGVVKADVIAFEPSPATHQHLCENIRLNDLAARVKPLNVALGGAAGELRFTTQLGTVNHIVSDREKQAEAVVVQVRPLDEVLAGRAPLVMKIDVEGYETEVMRGAEKTLANPAVSALLMEFNGSGARYGYDEKALYDSILNFGFVACSYDPFKRAITPMEKRDTDNILFARNLPQLQERVRTGPKITVNGATF